jgi:hypothetical protein
MSTAMDYELSRKYFLFHKDGLLDIFIGLGVLLTGAALWAEMVWMAGVWVAIFVPLWISARKSITYRRGTDVQPSGQGNFRFALVMSAALGVLLLGVMVALTFFAGFERLPAFRSFLDAYIHLLVGLGLAGFLAVTAAIMHLPRFYAYAALALAVFSIGHLAGWLFWMSLTLAGGLICLGGIVILGRFLQAHPVAE